ncbi:MAG: hypothetical protein KC619_28160 [Myxococcales bacterium]|nr:hypothetical protein [Myxococcales bacterium]
MTELLTALAELLRREREAALAGDLEALEELQSEKREAVDALLEAAPDDPDAIEALAVDARANVVLIRQLVGIHRALAGLEPSGYGADGRSQPPHAAGATRGVL